MHMPRKLQSTNCIYTYKNKAVILVYVDDLAIFAKNKETLDEVIGLLAGRYEIKNLGEVRKFLGVEFERRDGRWRIHQASYIEALAKHYGLEETRRVLIPLDAGIALMSDRKAEIGVAETTRYRSLIGALMFLASRTRPDIQFAVTCLSQYNSCPSPDKWRLLQRVLKYAHSTRNLSINCEPMSGQPKLVMYTDSSWASSLEDRKSWSGYIGLIADIPITWRTTKQRCVTLSTMESEFVGLSSAMIEVKWLHALCTELNWLNVGLPTKVLCDNQAAIAYAQNYNEHMQSKHIDIKYKFVREALKEQMCELSYVTSSNNLADMFTKPLPKTPFERFRDSVMSKDYEQFT